LKGNKFLQVLENAVLILKAEFLHDLAHRA